jgi:hypothetical protein
VNPEESLQVLAQATEPQAAGQISRAGYAAIEQALAVIRDLIANQPKPKRKPKAE